MKSKVLTLSAAIFLGAIVQGKVALLMEEMDSSPFAKLYSESISPRVTHASKLENRQEAKKLYRKGECVGTEDLYRFASLLAQSNNPDDLLLAHDCALASLIEGFRPAARAVQSSQKQLLRSIGLEISSKRSAGKETARPFVPLLEQFETSWAAAAKSVPQSLPGTVGIAVAD